MNARPLPLVMLLAGGALLGALLALDGLSARLFGNFATALGETRLWIELLEWLGDAGSPLFGTVDPYSAGWLPLVVGTALSGALAASWIGLRWGLNAVTLFAALALLHGGFVSVLAAVVLLGALLPTTRRWVAAAAS